MTKRTRRDIASRIEEIEEGGDEPAEWDVHSDVQVITDDMVDDDGTPLEGETPDPEPPEGYEHAGVIPTESPVVTWRELVPVDGGENTDR